MKLFQCKKCVRKDEMIGRIREDRVHTETALEELIKNIPNKSLNNLFETFNKSNGRSHQLLANLITMELSARARKVLEEKGCHTSMQKEGQA